MPLNKIWIFTKFIALSLSLSVLDLITIKRTCDYLGDMGPNYYGFPFVFRTEIPWVNSLSGNFYVFGFIGNFLFYLIMILFINYFLKRVKFKKAIQKSINISSNIIIVFIFIYSLLFFSVIDWNYEFKVDDFKKFGNKPIECDYSIEFIQTGS